MKYFTFGSNMCSGLLQSQVSSFKFVAIGFIKGYTLKFNKIGEDGSGKCNANYSNNLDDKIYGVLYELSEDEKDNLKEDEGTNRGYSEDKVVVNTAGGEFAAVMFEARSGFIDDALVPFDWYKFMVVEGAREHKLPKKYIQKIEQVECVDDFDEKRREEKLNQLKKFL